MISKIYAIADIHIRNFKRHDEYEGVFKWMFEYIESTKTDDSVIFLAGDIVHSKTDISPELVDITSKFLKRCADLLPTILIAGNHDFSPSTSRLDALTPIVNSLNHPNLHYWKDSGLYEMGGITFSVFGIMDGMENWVLAKDFDAPYKIALHHGSIKGSITDIGHEIETGITLQHFDGFQIGMCGDIHLLQFLNEEKTVGYSSSLVGQNYGESLDNHGFLVWDLPTRQSTFIEVPNNYGYVTFDLVDGDCIIPDNLPPNLRVRIRHQNTTLADIEAFVKRLSQKYKIVELIKQKNIDQQQQQIERNGLLGNNRNVEHQNKIIVDYLKSIQPDITPNELEQVVQLNIDTNRQLPVSSAYRGIVWKPVRLEFENMFSYGSDNVMDFSGLVGTNGISAKNAHGKSSIFDVLCFVLYDKTTRANKASHIINHSKGSFSCKLEFEINGKSYFIERIGQRKKDDAVKVDVNFWTIDEDGSEISLNGEDRDKTNYAIRNFVGNYDDFIMTSLSTQYDNQNFIEKSQRDRKELLYKFLDISIYDELTKLTKDEGKNWSVLIREYEREDLHSQSSQIYAQISTQSDFLKEVDVHLAEEKNSLRTKNTALLEETKKLKQTDVKFDLSEIEKGIETTTTQTNLCVQQIKEIEAKELEFKSHKGSIEEELVGRIPLNEDQFSIRELRIGELGRLQSQFNSIQKDLYFAISQEQKLSSHKYDPNCEFCTSNQFVIDANKYISEIPHQTEKLESLEIEIEQLKVQIEELNGLVEKETERRKLVSETERIEKELSYFNEQKKALKYKGKSLHDALKDWKEKKQQYELNLELIEANITTQSNIRNLETELKATEKRIQKLEDNHRKLFGEVQTLKSKYETIQEKLEKYLEYIKKNRIYELYLTAISREGVPYRILESILPVIEYEANQILSSLVDFTVRLEATDDKYIHAYIVYDDHRSWPVELTSGMERFILSLAFRTSLSDITTLPKANFLAIDEGFGVLDAENLQSMSNLFAYLKKQYDFLLCVSHIEVMKDMVDHQIKIEKTNGFSQIKV